MCVCAFCQMVVLQKPIVCPIQNDPFWMIVVPFPRQRKAIISIYM